MAEERLEIEASLRSVLNLGPPAAATGSLPLPQGSLPLPQPASALPSPALPLPLPQQSALPGLPPMPQPSSSAFLHDPAIVTMSGGTPQPGLPSSAPASGPPGLGPSPEQAQLQARSDALSLSLIHI